MTTVTEIRDPVVVVNLAVNQGASMTFRVTWSVDGTPQPLTDYKVYLTIGQTKGVRKPWLSANSVDDLNTIITLEPPDPDTQAPQIGVMVFGLTPAQTRAFTQDGRWQLDVAGPGGDVKRLVEGELTVNRAIVPNAVEELP